MITRMEDPSISSRRFSTSESFSIHPYHSTRRTSLSTALSSQFPSSNMSATAQKSKLHGPRNRVYQIVAGARRRRAASNRSSTNMLPSWRLQTNSLERHVSCFCHLDWDECSLQSDQSPATTKLREAWVSSYPSRRFQEDETHHSQEETSSAEAGSLPKSQTYWSRR